MILAVSLVRFVAAWNIQRRSNIPATRLLATVDKSTSTQQQTVLAGVPEFEKWFATVPGATCESSIVHEDVGNLRGLACDSTLASSREAWMTIPNSIVLQSDFTQSDWDTKLAQQLWQEVVKGPSSSISGYVALLAQGSSWRGAYGSTSAPPSTAPDALRHWSQEEKKLLASSSEGQRLLGLEQQQNELWRE